MSSPLKYSLKLRYIPENMPQLYVNNIYAGWLFFSLLCKVELAILSEKIWIWTWFCEWLIVKSGSSHLNLNLHFPIRLLYRAFRKIKWPQIHESALSMMKWYTNDNYHSLPTLFGLAVMVWKESMLTANKTDLLTNEMQRYITQHYSSKIFLLLDNIQFYL